MKRRFQSGFSLMEVLIATGLMGGMSVFIMTQTQNIRKLQKDLELTSDKTMAMQNLHLTSLEENCGIGNQLASINLSSPLNALTHELTELESSKFPMKKGEEIGGLKLEKITMTNFTQSASDATTIFADIQLHLYKGKNSSGGDYFNPQKSKVTVALTKNLNTGTAVGCSTVQDAAEVAKTCSSLGLPLAADGKTCVPNPMPKENIYLSASFCPSGDVSCKGKTAKCDDGDLAIAGDCYGGYAEGVQGDLVLNIPGNADCSGCPTDKSKCDDACLIFEYSGYGCNYYGNSVNLQEKGARILCMKRPKEAEIHVSQINKFPTLKTAFIQNLKTFPNQFELFNQATQNGANLQPLITNSLKTLTPKTFTLPPEIILKQPLVK